MKELNKQGESSPSTVSPTAFLSSGGLLLLPYQTSPRDPRASVAIDQGHAPGMETMRAARFSFEADILQAKLFQERDGKLVLDFGMVHVFVAVLDYPIKEGRYL
jgi:hypothetical protein